MEVGRCNHLNCPIQFDKVADNCDIVDCPYRTTSNLKFIYAFMLHREMGLPLRECLKAHEIAMQYLRDKSVLCG